MHYDVIMVARAIAFFLNVHLEFERMLCKLCN